MENHPDQKFCTRCQKTKIIRDHFSYKIVHDKYYLRCHCNECESEKRKGRNSSQAVRIAASRRYGMKKRDQRKNGINVARWILTDSRQSDKKHGRENNLTHSLIEELIANGCSYCGDNTIRMTLDRKDNNLGHISENVVPACIRCNYVRRDMPLTAWLLLIPTMRSARESGAFGKWTGAARDQIRCHARLGDAP